MENKYNELERLNQLKSNGTITELEYETEKGKLLKDNKKNKLNYNKIANILFILTGALAILTTIIIFTVNDMTNKIDIAEHGSHSTETYLDAETQYKVYGDRTKLNNYEAESKRLGILEDKRDILVVVSIVSGVITIVLLTTGIIFKIKEKKKN